MIVLVPSTASFRDTWQPWIQLAAIHWPDRPWPAVLVSDGDSAFRPEAQGFDEVRADGPDLGWSRNLLRALRGHGDHEIVLMVLDDFWPLEPWDTDAIKAATRVMQRREKIGCFRLHPCPGPQRDETLANQVVVGARGEYGYGLVHRGEPYRISTQPALWRVGFLRRLLGLSMEAGPGSAWSFERPDGGGPSATWTDEVWSVLRSAPRPWPCECFVTAIVRGAWHVDALALLERHGIPRPVPGRALWAGA